MPKTILEELLRKPIVVRANGIEYRGLLIEVTPHDITLRRDTGFITIPMDRITSLIDPNAKEKARAPTFIDKSFYIPPDPTLPEIKAPPDDDEDNKPE
jgi:hypothetical protein